MLSIPLYDKQGKRSGEVEIDPQILGGEIRPQLLKQAIVAWQANARQGSSATRSRGMVIGSTRKLYRQKGTGNARAGARRTCVRRGGGVAFAKGQQNYSQSLNKKMKRLARNNAILAKIQSEQVVVIEDIDFDVPSTKRFVSLLSAMGADQGCLFAMGGADDPVYRSGRNVLKTEVRPFAEICAYDVLLRRKLVLTRSALDVLTGQGAGKES